MLFRPLLLMSPCPLLLTFESHQHYTIFLVIYQLVPLRFLMEQDACVSDLADRLGLTQSAVSHQLSLLKANKLVRQRRDGKMIFYTLVDDHVRMVIEKGTEHVLLR